MQRRREKRILYEKINSVLFGNSILVKYEFWCIVEGLSWKNMDVKIYQISNQVIWGNFEVYFYNINWNIVICLFRVYIFYIIYVQDGLIELKKKITCFMGMVAWVTAPQTAVILVWDQVGHLNDFNYWLIFTTPCCVKAIS